MSRTVSIVAVTEEQNIKIVGLSPCELLINYSGDIDFTELVTSLTDLINSEEIIILSIEEYDNTDQKLKIIMETTNSIFEKYSESMTIVEQDESDDALPF